jgi:phytoene dehydrogenase-like protein
MDDAGVVVVGGGHNGLVAAILAAQAGLRVTVLERSGAPGGATVGAQLFPPYPVRLSRYSYLIALFPDQLIHRLGIDLTLVSRGISSYTPVTRGGAARGLLVERDPGVATEDSFRELTGSDSEFRSWRQIYAEMHDLARVIAPTMTGPLRRRRDVRDAVIAAAGEQIWTDVVDKPLGEMIVRRFRDDTVRGVVATDGVIGTHTSLFDPDLLANRCFLYHLIGRGTGEWMVPIGGMGALTDALLTRARALGVEIRCGVEVLHVEETPQEVRVTGTDDGREIEITGSHLLAAVAPAVVDGWLDRATEVPTGAQIKINMLLERLPRLASGIDPRTAFSGTMHLDEGFWDLEAAYATTAGGQLPAVVPAEVYCHSLTDPSILGGFGGATLTLFGLHTPVELFRSDPDAARAQAAQGALIALQRHLAEPLLDCLARDAAGEPCLDISSPVDLERSIGMPGGNIFHDDLSWPWLADGYPADTPAARHGVEILGSTRILLAGAGTRRGGGVSGLGGAAAVDALLEMMGDPRPG